MAKFPMRIRIRKVRDNIKLEVLAQTSSGSWFIKQRAIAPTTNLREAILWENGLIKVLGSDVPSEPVE